MGELFTNLAKAIDWIGARLILLALLGTAVFAVFQPLVWEWAFDKSTPIAVANLGTLVTVLVTLLSLSLAGFGILAYGLVSGKLQERLMERSAEIEKEVARRTLALGESTLSKLQLMASRQAWQSYSELWRATGWDPKFTQDLGFGELVGTALNEAEVALRRTKTLPKGDEFDLLFMSSQNAVAYHLATRQLASDKERALVLASDLDPTKENHHAHETIAWVYMRFCEEKDPKYKEAVEIVRRLSADDKIPLAWRERLRERYAALFSVDFGKESQPPE